MRHYRIPWTDAFPSDVAVDGSGRLWFTDRLTHGLGVFDPTDATFERIETPTAKSALYGLIRTPDGMLWFGESNGGRLGRLNPGTGVDVDGDRRIHVETLSQPSRPYGITVDRRGWVWFAEQGNETIVVYDPRRRARRVLRLPVPGGTVRNIAVDDERGRAWLPLSDVGVIAMVEF
jgi:streptogramin lyase